jgi:hypothetical protein
VSGEASLNENGTAKFRLYERSCAPVCNVRYTYSDRGDERRRNNLGILYSLLFPEDLKKETKQGEAKASLRDRPRSQARAFPSPDSINSAITASRRWIYL